MSLRNSRPSFIILEPLLLQSFEWDLVLELKIELHVSLAINSSEMYFSNLSQAQTLASNFLEISKIKSSGSLTFNIGISKHT